MHEIEPKLNSRDNFWYRLFEPDSIQINQVALWVEHEDGYTWCAFALRVLTLF